jgi:two-component system sensor histidine kinase SenX3
VSPLVALVVGLILGGVVATTVILRSRLDPDGPGAAADAPLLPEAALARRLLDLMDPPVVLVDTDDAVLLANPAARALGIVRGRRLMVPELLGLVHEVRAGGNRRADVRLPGDLAGTGPRLVGVHGVRLHSGAHPPPAPVALVLQDVTEARRVEAVRRDFVANVGHELKPRSARSHCWPRRSRGPPTTRRRCSGSRAASLTRPTGSPVSSES